MNIKPIIVVAEAVTEVVDYLQKLKEKRADKKKQSTQPEPPTTNESQTDDRLENLTEVVEKLAHAMQTMQEGYAADLQNLQTATQTALQEICNGVSELEQACEETKQETDASIESLRSQTVALQDELSKLSTDYRSYQKRVTRILVGLGGACVVALAVALIAILI